MLIKISMVEQRLSQVRRFGRKRPSGGVTSEPSGRSGRALRWIPAVLSYDQSHGQLGRDDRPRNVPGQGLTGVISDVPSLVSPCVPVMDAA